MGIYVLFIELRLVKSIFRLKIWLFQFKLLRLFTSSLVRSTSITAVCKILLSTVINLTGIVFLTRWTLIHHYLAKFRTHSTIKQRLMLRWVKELCPLSYLDIISSTSFSRLAWTRILNWISATIITHDRWLIRHIWSYGCFFSLSFVTLCSATLCLYSNSIWVSICVHNFLFLVCLVYQNLYWLRRLLSLIVIVLTIWPLSCNWFASFL